MNTELLAAHMSLVLDEPAQVARNLAIRWVTSSQGSYKRWLKYSKANSATIIELADELKNQDVESLVAFLNFNRSKGKLRLCRSSRTSACLMAGIVWRRGAEEAGFSAMMAKFSKNL